MTSAASFWWRVELGSGGAIVSIRRVEAAEANSTSVHYVQAETEDSARYAGRAAFNAYMREQAAKRRARLKAEGKCPWCGCAADRGVGKRCSACVARDVKYSQRKRDKEAGKTVPKLDRLAAIKDRREREDRAVAERAVLSAAGQQRLEVLEEVQRAWLDNRTVGAFSAWLNSEIEKLNRKRKVAGLTQPTLTLDVWRSAAVALCEHACGYDAGRSKDDLVYVEVTEGRDGPGPEQRKRYSSCGDLAHWLYKRLGIRDPFVNRTDDGVNGPWRAGENIARLWGGACPFDQVPPADPLWVPEPGDVLLIWNTGFDAHVMVALGLEPGGKLRTANYGAGGMSAALSPGARIGASNITHQRGLPFYGARRIQRWLPLAEAVKRITVAPDLRGAALSGEEVDAIELGWSAK